MTGEVGTALYVSPEMMKGGSKLRYDQVSRSDLFICLSELCVCVGGWVGRCLCVVCVTVSVCDERGVKTTL